MPTLRFGPNVDPNKLKRPLGNTDYTVDRVLELFHGNCEEFARDLNDNSLEKIEIEEIGQGKGYCSNIYKIQLHFPTNDTQEAVSTFIVKISSDEKWSELEADFSEEDRQKYKQHVIEMHNCECAIYQLFRQFKNLPVPKAYYCEQADNLCSGIIIMEDASGKGASASVFESATVGQCANVARTLADFQTQLNFVEDQSWRKKFKRNVQAMHKVDSVVNGLIESALEFDDKELTDQIRTYHKMDLQRLAKFAMEEYTGKQGCNTLLHADVWMNNLLMQYNEDGSISEQLYCILDWQIACIGNPLYDLASFLLLCASPELRHECERQMIDLYYDELARHYKERNATPGFSKEQAHEFYNVACTQLVVCLIMTCAVHALPLKDSKDPKERAKCEALLHRLRVAFRDVWPTLEKYGIPERFALHN